MRTPSYSKQFDRDVKRMKKRGKEMQKLREILTLLVKAETLPEKNRNHKLVGPFKSYRECHIEPDWLLIYKIEDPIIFFARTGSHSDLFE